MLSLHKENNRYTLYLDHGVQYHIFHRGVPVALWYEGESYSWEGELYDVIVCTADELALRSSYRFKWSRYIVVDVADWRTTSNITAIQVESRYEIDTAPYFFGSFPFSLMETARLFIPAIKSGVHIIRLVGLDANGDSITRPWTFREYAMVPDIPIYEWSYTRLSNTQGRLGFKQVIMEGGA